jgi:hypothetical protein
MISSYGFLYTSQDGSIDTFDRALAEIRPVTPATAPAKT